MKAFPLVVLVGMVALGGCKSSQPSSSGVSGSPSVSTPPKSPIVAHVESAGAGDLDNTDSGTIQAWFGKHVQVARDIVAPCKEISESATADWRNSTEGRVCTTAANVVWLSPSGVFQAPHKYPQRKF